MPKPRSVPLPLEGKALVHPTALSCLRCQLLGRRKLLCSSAEVCEEVPHVFALGPVLVLAWAATLAAFLFAVK